MNARTLRGVVSLLPVAALVACSSASTPPPTPYHPILSATTITVSPDPATIAAGGDSVALSASEAGYAGSFAASLACTPAGTATVAPSAASPTAQNAPVSFTVTSAGGAGTCTVTIADAAAHATQVAVAVAAASPLVVSPGSASPPISGTRTFVVSRAGYGGQFTATDSCPPTVEALSPGNSAPSRAGAGVVFTVRGLQQRACTITVVDATGQRRSIVADVGPATLFPNGDFASPVITTQNGTYNGNIDAWSGSAQIYAGNGSGGGQPAAPGSPVPPPGTQAAYSPAQYGASGASLSPAQPIPTDPVATTTYSIGFDAAATAPNDVVQITVGSFSQNIPITSRTFATYASGPIPVPPPGLSPTISLLSTDPSALLTTVVVTNVTYTRIR